MRALLLTASLFLLSSCLLKQNEPKPAAPQPGKIPLDGIVAMEDVQGAVTGGVFFAAFTPRVAAATTASWVGLHRYAVLETRDDREVRCEIAKKPKTAPPAASVGFVNVGKLVFGVALQTASVDVMPSPDNRYIYKLNPGFAAGVYQVAAKATEQTQPFEGLLTVPESLRDLTGNGVKFNERVVSVKKATGLRLQWSPPSVPNDNHIILLDFESETATEVHRLRCMAREPQGAGAGTLITWDVEPALVKQMPASKKARIDFLRAVVRNVKSTYLMGEFQGLRTNIAAATIED